MTDTTDQETHAQAQKLRGQNGSENCRLNNLELVILDQDHEHDNLDDRSKCCLDKNPQDSVQLRSQFLTSETNEIGARNHCEVVENKDCQMEIGSNIRDSHCCRYNWPEDITDSRSSTCGVVANPQELKRIDPLSTTLTCRLNAGSDTRKSPMGPGIAAIDPGAAAIEPGAAATVVGENRVE